MIHGILNSELDSLCGDFMGLTFRISSRLIYGCFFEMHIKLWRTELLKFVNMVIEIYSCVAGVIPIKNRFRCRGGMEHLII